MKKLHKHLEAILAVTATLGVIAIGIAGYIYLHPPLTHLAKSHTRNKLSPVVRLTNSEGRTFCTGVVVSEHTVITAGHCVLAGVIFGMPVFNEDLEVRPAGAEPPGVKVKVAYLSTQLDQATLIGDFSGFEPRAVITDIAKLVEIAKVNTIFTSCGYPMGGALYCSKFKYVGKINFMWLGKGELLPGMSGGPTMLEDGTVIAINDAVVDEFSIVTPVWNTPIEK